MLRWLSLTFEAAAIASSLPDTPSTPEVIEAKRAIANLRPCYDELDFPCLVAFYLSNEANHAPMVDDNQPVHVVATVLSRYLADPAATLELLVKKASD
jgi:hypothetical protein